MDESLQVRSEESYYIAPCKLQLDIQVLIQVNQKVVRDFQTGACPKLKCKLDPITLQKMDYRKPMMSSKKISRLQEKGFRQ